MMKNRYTDEEILGIMKNVLEQPESEYMVDDNLEGELDIYYGKYMVLQHIYGNDRTKTMPYIRRIFTITRRIIEQYDGTEITVTAQPKGKGDAQTPSVEGDRRTSDTHAGCHDDGATADIIDRR